MYPTLFLICLWSLACFVNGQTPRTPASPTPPVPTPSQVLTRDDILLPSPDQVMMANNNFPPPSESELRPTLDNQPGLPPLPTDGIIPRRSDGTILDRDLPLPPPGSVDPTDRPISVGNIQVIYNDELRAIMKDYEITPDEIRRMLELYAQGGSATITKRRVNPTTGLQEVITLDFDKFTTQTPSGRVTPPADPITGIRPTDPIRPTEMGPSDGVPQTSLRDLQETERYLQEQIRELDAQFVALDMAYRRGEITQRTRDENGVVNRDSRRRFQSDLVAIQQEIDRINGRSKTDEPMPQPFTNIPREITPPTGLGTTLTELDRIQRENQILEEQLRAITVPRGSTPGRQIPGLPLSGRPRTPTISPLLPGSQRSGQQHLSQQRRGQQLLPTTSPTGPSSLDALRRELINIRTREMYILNQLRQLSRLGLRNSQLLRNGRIQFGRNGPLGLLPTRQRINFRNTNVPQVRRTLPGSVTGQEIERRRVM